MTIYEEDDFDKAWNPEQMKFNKKVDKLKAIRRKRKHDEELKELDGIPTTDDLEEKFGAGE